MHNTSSLERGGVLFDIPGPRLLFVGGKKGDQAEKLGGSLNHLISGKRLKPQFDHKLIRLIRSQLGQFHLQLADDLQIGCQGLVYNLLGQ